MINQPSPPNGCEHHAVAQTLIDPQSGVLEIVVGSWPTPDTSRRPLIETLLKVKYAQWLPEHYNAIEQTVNEHPQWTGLPPAMPNAHCCFNVETLLWEDMRALADVKAAQWSTIKVARDAAITKPLVTPYGTFDATPGAQKSITDAVLMLQTLESMGTPETIDFTLADNTTVTLTTQQMVHVGLLLGAQTQTAYTVGRGLRAQIEAATSIADVEAVTWPT